MRTLQKSFYSWCADEAASILFAFALLLPALVTASGGAMDMAGSFLVAQRLSGSLDAAALAATASKSNPADITTRVNQFIAANYPSTKMGTVRNVTVTTSGNNVTVSAYADYPTSFLKVIGINKLSVYRTTTVQQLVGNNIELAMVLDISGSMNDNGKIAALRTAATTLVDTVVADNINGYYAKIALVPYSVAVNVGNYATQARGAVSGPPLKITAATKASPVVVTAAGHGFTNGQTVYITGVTGMTQINNLSFTVANATTNTFALSGINGKNYSTFTAGYAGRVCTTPGCGFYQYVSPSGNTNIFPYSTCVSERSGTYAYTDDPFTTALVGTNYASPNNPCLSNQIEPLTTNKTTLEKDVAALAATGSTGGQVGIGWGFYMLSPNLGGLWPTGSAPAAYGTKNLHKIAVIMTDGEYNSPYCKGAIASDATTGSGATADHINCKSSNGDSYDQGKALCDAMKKKNIEIYTIGFEVDDYPNGKAMMQYCATDSSHFFLAESSDGLQTAFQAIAKNVNGLYISQ